MHHGVGQDKLIRLSLPWGIGCLTRLVLVHLAARSINQFKTVSFLPTLNLILILQVWVQLVLRSPLCLSKKCEQLNGSKKNKKRKLNKSSAMNSNWMTSNAETKKRLNLLSKKKWDKNKKSRGNERNKNLKFKRIRKLKSKGNNKNNSFWKPGMKNSPGGR